MSSPNDNPSSIASLVSSQMEREAAQHLARTSAARREALNAIEVYRGTSISAQKIRDTILKVAPTDHSVMIIGPTGTGKELIARALHWTRKGSFIGINCAALPENLLESELFGHTKGSFTGATSDKEGLMETAKDGTIFLDEINSMPSHLQAKLLRVVQERSVRRVGDHKERSINCRFVAAGITTESLRDDLIWRLGTITIDVPPLGQRGLEDTNIITLAMGYPTLTLEEYNSQQGFARGNVRELQSYIIRKQLGII